MNKLFVYGILLNMYEGARPAVLKGFRKEYFGNACIVDDLEGETQGQLIEVDDDAFRRIDRIEGFPTYYTRFKVKVECDEEIEECWVYQMNPEFMKGDKK
jgi:gamma-glutamylcyclotransferase (GGCT)/AIG2-like uncharacterized protein YtfP